MHKFLILAALCYGACALSEIKPSRYDGCVCMIISDDDGILLCNGTTSTGETAGPACQPGSIKVMENGATRCETFEETGCGKPRKREPKPCCNGATGPRGVQGPVASQEPVYVAGPAGVAGAPGIPTAPARSLFSYIWSPFEAVLYGIFNTVTEILMRAIAFSISRIIDMLVVGAMAYGINKFMNRAKSGWMPKAEPPIVPAFPGAGNSLVQ